MKPFYYADIPPVLQWIDSLVFLSTCLWVLAAIESLATSQATRISASNDRRLWFPAVLILGAAAQGVLLVGINLFLLENQRAVFLLLVALPLAALLAATGMFQPASHISGRRDLDVLAWPVVSGLLGLALYGTRAVASDQFRHSDLTALLLAIASVAVSGFVLHRVLMRYRLGQGKSFTRNYLACVVFILLGGGFFLTLETNRAVDRFRNKLLSVASIGARTLPREDLLRLRGVADDVGQDYYRHITAALSAIRNDFPGIQYSYLWTYRAGQLLFLADGSANDISAPGEVFREVEVDPQYYHQSSPHMLVPFRDKWGCWVSANHPLRHPNTGGIFAWLGLDFPANDYYATIGSARLQVMSFTGLLLATLGLCRSVRRSSFADLELEKKSIAIRNREQRRIAGLLHDDVGQVITALSLEATLLEQVSACEPAKAGIIATRIKKLVALAATKNRDLAHGLSAHLVRPEEFSADLARQTRLLGELLSLEVDLHLSPPAFACASQELAEDIFHILQESLSNVARHGQGKRARVECRQEPDCWRLIIENSVTDPSLDHPETNPGIGLRLMASRVLEIGGQFSFRHLPTGTAQVDCEFPPGTFIALDGFLAKP